MNVRARLGLSVVSAALALPVAAYAQAEGESNMSAAANAYQRAQVAELAGDHERAAGLYELADSLAASAPALRGAHSGCGTRPPMRVQP